MGQQERFWAKVRRSEGCWEWTSARHTWGYGKARLDGHDMTASRAAWILEHGPIPPGMWVLHKCDNPPCVRPDHLFLGTPADNSRDMVAKGRQALGDRNSMRLYPERVPRGEGNGHAVLTEAMVRAIRAACAAGEPQRAVGKRFGTSQRNVGRIARRQIWRHVA